MEISGYGTLTGTTRGAKRNLTSMYLNQKRVFRYQDAVNQQKLQKQRFQEQRRKELNDKWLSGKVNKDAMDVKMSKLGASNSKVQPSTEGNQDADEKAKKATDEEEGAGAVEYDDSLELPEWTIKQDQIEVFLAQARSQLHQLKKLQTDSLKVTFASSSSDHDSLSSDKAEQRKFDLELNFKRLMAQCKTKLGEITELSPAIEGNETAVKVTQNVTQSVLIKMQELSKEYTSFKTRQRTISTKYQSKPSQEGTSLLYSTEETDLTFDSMGEEQELSVLEQSAVVDQRSDQINKITTEMRQLSELFQQVNQMVLNQDSVLNRIDYNVEQSVIQIQRANENLTAVEQRESNSIGRKVIIAETTLILVFLLVLITRAL